MYKPNTIANDFSQWQNLTDAFHMCSIKINDTTCVHPDGSTGIAYSVDHIYAFLKDPRGQGSTLDFIRPVMQFLEEGAIDLVCLMTGLSMDRCDAIRKLNNVTGTSDCWKSSCTRMYG